jgi:amino acid transporter
MLIDISACSGYDASAHLAEETHRASWSAPVGVLMSIGVSAVFGWFLILCLLFSIQDLPATLDPTQNYGEPVFKILVDVFGPDGALVLITLIVLCVWHCGLFSLTSNSRMMFAFSRDGALPRFFDHVDARFHSPTRTVWLAAFLAFCLSLPSLGSAVAFSAATSIATIGLDISYALPILIAAIWPDHFAKGPFDLGRFSWPVAVVACLWVRVQPTCL